MVVKVLNERLELNFLNPCKDKQLSIRTRISYPSGRWKSRIDVGVTNCSAAIADKQGRRRKSLKKVASILQRSSIPFERYHGTVHRGNVCRERAMKGFSPKKVHA